MQSTAKHIRLFRVYYRTPQRSNIDRCVHISVHIVSAVIAFKYLSFPIAYVVAVATSLACISWINQNNLNTIKNGFVGYVLTQLIERPFANSCSKFLAFFQRRKADTFKVFNCNPFIFFFSNLNNLFGYRVVDNRSGGAFSATKPFQEFFTSSCAFALNGASHFLSFFSIGLKLVRVKFFTIAKSSNTYQTKVHTRERLYIFHIIFNYINSLKQVEFTFSKKQIRFTFDIRKIVGIVANKWHLQSASNRPDGNHITFVRKNTTVISNAAKWFKSTFNFLIQFVGISHFGDTAYQYLCGKIRGTFQFVVNLIVNLKLVKYLLLPSYFRNSITNRICFLNSFKEQISLFFGRQKFNLQRKFHGTNLTQIFEITKSEQQVAFLPSAAKLTNGFPASHL